MEDEKIIEEVLEFIWTQREEGRDSIEKLLSIEEIVHSGATRTTLIEIERMGLVTTKDDTIRLTEKGEKISKDIIRRHRLAERLLHDVLDVGDDMLEKQACSFEHSLSPVVADSICTLLGHPPTCPHGLPIPKGGCCGEKGGLAMKPLVRPLDQAEIGENARIAFIMPKTSLRIQKLGSMGLVPGSIIKITQKKPAFVVEMGETTLALDTDIARDIYVRKSD